MLIVIIIVTIIIVVAGVKVWGQTSTPHLKWCISCGLSRCRNCCMMTAWLARQEVTSKWPLKNYCASSWVLPLHPCYCIITIIIIKIINPCPLKSSLLITLSLLLLLLWSSSSSSSSLKGRCTIIEKDIVGSNYLSFALKVPATPTFPENNISQRKNCTACSYNLDSVTILDSV